MGDKKYLENYFHQFFCTMKLSIAEIIPAPIYQDNNRCCPNGGNVKTAIEQNSWSVHSGSLSCTGSALCAPRDETSGDVAARVRTY